MHQASAHGSRWLGPINRYVTTAAACSLVATVVVVLLLYNNGSGASVREAASGQQHSSYSSDPVATAAAAAAQASSPRPHLPLHRLGFELEARMRQQVFCEEAFPLLEVKESTAKGGSVAAREVAFRTTIYVYPGDDAVSRNVREGHGWEEDVLGQVLWAMHQPRSARLNATEAAATPRRALQSTAAAAVAALNSGATAATPADVEVDTAAGILASDQPQPSTNGQPNKLPPPLFVDVGANVGWFSVNVAARGFRVAAFEGMATNVALVRSSVCASLGLGDRLRLFAFGLGAADDTCYLFSGVDNRGDGITMCGVASEAEAAAKVPSGYALRGRLPIHRLDAVLQPPPPGAAEGHANEIQVLKMDVEGYEPHVLAGLGPLRPRFLATEYNPILLAGVNAGYRPGQLLDDLMARGYRLSTAGFKGPWMTQAEVHSLVERTRELINVFGAHQDLFA